MPQHGFARDSLFAVTQRSEASVTMRLTDDERTRTRYPFAFELAITFEIAPQRLGCTIRVTNRDERALPYALGFHPAFPWPFSGSGIARDTGHRVRFERPERAEVPEVGVGGLLTEVWRPVPLENLELPLSPALFEEALVWLDAASRSVRFVAPDGSAIAMEVEDFPHLAVWTKPTAPFLSLECWTGHADMAGFEGDLFERRSQRLLQPGAAAVHRVHLTVEART